MENILDKPYELTFEERPGYLYVYVKAPHISPAMAKSWIARTAEECEATGCERLMIERDVPSEPTTYSLVAVNDFVGLRNGPVAIVNPHDGVIGDTLRRQIEAGALLGSQAAYFTDVPTAEAWLLSR